MRHHPEATHSTVMDGMFSFLCCADERRPTMQNNGLFPKQNKNKKGTSDLKQPVKDTVVDEETPMHLNSEEMLLWLTAGKEDRKKIARSSLGRHNMQLLDAMLLIQRKRRESNETVPSHQQAREDATIARLQANDTSDVFARAVLNRALISLNLASSQSCSC